MALPIVLSHCAQLFEPKELVQLQTVSKSTYLALFPVLHELYQQYLKSDKYRLRVLNEMNHLSYMIDQFKWQNKILNNKMYEYVILCYENWSWITLDNHTQQLQVPSSNHFVKFLQEHGIQIHEILPNIEFHYTHHHRPTKSFTYYKTIKPQKPHA